MAALPGLPLKVSMDVCKWMEDKFENIPSLLVKRLCFKILDFCKNHPFIGACVTLTVIISLGPLMLLLGFLLFTNTCLFIGFAFVEFLIIAAGLSVFIPTFLAGTVFSVAMTSVFALLNRIWLGKEQKKNKLRKSKYNKSSHESITGNARNPPLKIEELENKTTQTTEWIEQTGQTEKGTIEEISISKLIDEELNDEDASLYN